ncbi:hypothetical protein BKA65DRAFT_109857 [Rhexocercosporidium sp. MPI-PUGE-AT-0058]|nr:hypothetical protein BKA65DRAFT_109857 [Rhexocercosporidium sp. MPI-PUGE-AT-0058]
MGYIDRGNGPSLVACTIVPFVLTWAFSSVRIYVRRFVLKIWKIEDWLFLASQICFSVLAMCAFVATIYGNGQHLKTVAAKDLPTVMKYWYSSELIYIVTSLLIRLSIGFFLLRICNLRAHIWTIRITMATMIVVSVMYFGFMVFQCRPISYFWLRFTDGQGYCFTGRIIADITIVFSVFAATADLIFGILPIFIIWDLKINRKTKIIIGGLLTLGILAGLSVIIRIIYVNSLSDPEEDFTFLTFKVAIWSIIEPAIGIICMAITTYRPLFKSLRDKISQNSRSNSTTQAQDGTLIANGKSSKSKNAKSSKTKGKKPSTYILPSQSRSRSTAGYTRTGSSIDSHAFEDVMEMDGMQRQPSVTGGRREGDGAGVWDEDYVMKDGIMMSTTVEIHRSPKGRDGDDMV